MSESETILRALRGVIVSFKTGPRTQSSRECIVHFGGVESSEQAARLLGRKVAWPVGERKIRGKVVAVHGKNGLVRVRFRKGLPGRTGMQIEAIG